MKSSAMPSVSTTAPTTTAHGDFYGQPLFDDRHPFEGRRRKRGAGTGSSRYLTRSEEEVAIGRKTVKAGMVEAQNL